MRAQEWLDDIRRKSVRIERVQLELSALEDARDKTLPWQTRGAGGSGGRGTHTDPTASEAERRMVELDGLIADKRHELDALTDAVGDCGSVLEHMAAELGKRHALALEMYYLDMADTWSEVADELEVTYRRVAQLRAEAYEWIEIHYAGFLSTFHIECAKMSVC